MSGVLLVAAVVKSSELVAVVATALSSLSLLVIVDVVVAASSLEDVNADVKVGRRCCSCRVAVTTTDCCKVNPLTAVANNSMNVDTTCSRIIVICLCSVLLVEAREKKNDFKKDL